MIEKKLHNKFGFTLVETLTVCIILLLVSLVVATGMPAAKNAYDRAIEAANAHVLLSTAANTLRSQLGTAQDVEVKEVKVNEETDQYIIIYDNERKFGSQGELRYKSKIIFEKISEKNYKIELYDFIDYNLDRPNDFVTTQAGGKKTEEFCVICDQLPVFDETKGIITIRGLCIKKSVSGSTKLKEIPGRIETLPIRVLPKK